jgi:hypothetical protein
MLAEQTRRNSYTLLCQLAPEILGRILLFAQVGAEGAHIVRAPWIDFDPSWTRWMLVCRHVREVAVGTPMLWTFLFLSKRRELNTEWWYLCVSRAKNYPLEFVVDYDIDRRLGPREAFLRAHWNRALRMDLDYRSSFQRGIKVDVLPKVQFPQLEYLRVIAYMNNLTAQFLGGISTTLTHLELHMLSSVIQGAPRLPALRTLKLVVKDIGGSQTHPRHFAMLLLGAPALEALSIHATTALLDFASEDALRAAPAFSLPNLHTLELLGPRHGLSGLLRLLPRPRSALSIAETWRVNNDDIGMSAYLHEFWQAAARREQLPPARIGCDSRTKAEQETTMHFELGVPFTFDTDASEPRIFFRSPCIPGVENFIPMDRVDALHLVADYEDFSFQPLVGIRHQIREVILKETWLNPAKETLLHLEHWLQEGHCLKVLRFIELPTTEHQFTWRLMTARMQEAGIVQTVLHEVSEDVCAD